MEGRDGSVKTVFPTSKVPEPTEDFPGFRVRDPSTTGEDQKRPYPEVPPPSGFYFTTTAK